MSIPRARCTAAEAPPPPPSPPRACQCTWRAPPQLPHAPLLPPTHKPRSPSGCPSCLKCSLSALGQFHRAPRRQPHPAPSPLLSSDDSLSPYSPTLRPRSPSTWPRTTPCLATSAAGTAPQHGTLPLLTPRPHMAPLTNTSPFPPVHFPPSKRPFGNARFRISAQRIRGHLSRTRAPTRATSPLPLLLLPP
jgi:hypothetical protein